MTPVADLRAAVEAAAGAAGQRRARRSRRPTLERPKQADHGDYATNAALVLAPRARARRRARWPSGWAARCATASATALERVEVAGPGLPQPLPRRRLVRRRRSTGCSRPATASAAPAPTRPERVNVEFVSANPTGPLTAASGRHAAYGDALARVLSFAGHDVDARVLLQRRRARQVDELGESIRARARGEELPEGGYQGDYVTRARRRRSPARPTWTPTSSPRSGVELMFERIQATLRAYRVDFDVCFTERALHEGTPSAIERGLARLSEQGHLYRSDGALWLRTTDFGDDKDRVLERSTGEPTYFAADVAYHEDKLERGFDLLIIVLGSDHHGYVARHEGDIAALGADPDRLEIPLLQFVHIVEGGVARVDVQAPRRVHHARRAHRRDRRRRDALVHALALARLDGRPRPRPRARAVGREPRLLRPVRARAHRLGAGARRGRSGWPRALAATAPPDVELHPSERALVKKLLAFPDEVAEAAERRAPHRIAAYALDLAQVFTAFYRDCLVVGAEPAEASRTWRLRLSVVTQRTIARAARPARRLGPRRDVAGSRRAVGSAAREHALQPGQRLAQVAAPVGPVVRARARSRPRRGGCRAPAAAVEPHVGAVQEALERARRAAGLRRGAVERARPPVAGADLDERERPQPRGDRDRQVRAPPRLVGAAHAPRVGSDPISSAPENDAAAANVCGWRAA